MKQTLILASSSEYRRQLLQKLQIPFTSIAPKIDETPLPNEKPHETALRLAQEKAKKIGAEYPHALVIGCDQVATLDGEQLGKPLTHENAVRQLSAMRGHRVNFYTAITLLNARDDEIQTEMAKNCVSFRNFSDDEIESYLRKEQPYHCAGSAKSEGLGIALISRMEGDDPTALIGLPLILLVSMLKKLGVLVL